MNPMFSLALDVTSLSESVRFYSTLLDVAPGTLDHEHARFTLGSPAIHLVLQEKEHCCLQGLNHMALQVKTRAEMHRIKARLEEAGYRTVGGPDIPSFQDKFWVRDPSSYRWEVFILAADRQDEQSEKSPAPAAREHGRPNPDR